jgi:ectoine hydroxylase-related dioxygenase (phytanoyl-CoA dioxygenase family)
MQDGEVCSTLSGERLLPERSREGPSAAAEAELAEHALHLKSHGYTVLRNVLSDAVVAEARARLDVRMAAKMETVLGEDDGVALTGAEVAARGSTISIGGAENSPTIGFPGLLGAAPEVAELLVKPFLLNPRLLDLAERIMGPFVQGDGFYVVGTPPPSYTGAATGLAARSELLAEAAGWHRDAYSHHSMWRSNPGWADDLAAGGQHTPPLAMHMLCYLQDMDGPGGSLLAVPGSHRSAFGDRPSTNEEEDAVLALDARAGDAVVFHCDMLHSGSANRAADGAWRYMVTSFVVRSGLPHRDDFTGPSLVKALVSEARARGDRRVLRFFTADEEAGGPLRREEALWRATIEAERQQLHPAL